MGPHWLVYSSSLLFAILHNIFPPNLLLCPEDESRIFARLYAHVYIYRIIRRHIPYCLIIDCSFLVLYVRFTKIWSASQAYNSG